MTSERAPSAAGPGRSVPSAPGTLRAFGTLHRSADDRVVAGVAGGLAGRLGLGSFVLRAAFVVFAFAGGVGLVLYALGWAALPARSHAEAPPRPVHVTPQRAAAIGLIYLGGLLLCRSLGLWFGDGVVWPIAITAMGAAVIWGRDADDPLARAGLANLTDATEASPLRLIAGAALIVGGAVLFVATRSSLGQLRDVMLAAAVFGIGAALVFGPWAARLYRQLARERHERIRTQAHAEMATHLHDSVLQTLALIQRAADDPRRTVRLARRQERELRAWLYEGAAALGADDSPAATVRSAVTALVEEVEEDHDITVDAVVVGDPPLDDGLRALLAAAREASVNAAKHAAVERVSLYVEAEPDVVRAYVTDRGRGFDPAAVHDDRHGIRDSIVGRLRAHGGTAEVLSAPGAGTEVTMTLPRARDDGEAPRAGAAGSPPGDVVPADAAAERRP